MSLGGWSNEVRTKRALARARDAVKVALSLSPGLVPDVLPALEAGVAAAAAAAATRTASRRTEAQRRKRHLDRTAGRPVRLAVQRMDRAVRAALPGMWRALS